MIKTSGLSGLGVFFKKDNMVLATLDNSKRYESLHPLFARLFEYVKTHDLLNEPLGRIVIEGDELFINNVETGGHDPHVLEGQVLEMHRDYIDIHIPLSAPEVIGWKDVKDIKTFTKEYTKEGDCALTDEPSDAFVTVRPGQFCIVWPEDAHAPALSKDKFRKLIVKVKL